MPDRPEKYRLEESIGYQVRRVTRALRRRLDHNLGAAGIDATSDQWAILVNLAERDGQSQQRLGYIAIRDKASITRLLDEMEKRSLVVRVPGQEDRREKLIHLTRKGRELYQAMLGPVQQTLREAQAGIAREQLDICKQVLKRMGANLEG